jgi:hypothetical protein
MEWTYHLGGAAGAGILSVAPVNDLMTWDLMIWAWLLIAAEVAVWTLLRKEAQKQVKSVPVLSNTRRPRSRATPHASRR